MLDPYILHNATVILPGTFLILIHPRSAPNLGISRLIWGQTLEILNIKENIFFCHSLPAFGIFFRTTKLSVMFPRMRRHSARSNRKPGGMIILCFSANTLAHCHWHFPPHNCFYNTVSTHILSRGFVKVVVVRNLKVSGWP